MATEGLPFFAMNPIIAGSKLCFRKSAISYKTYGAKVNDDENPLWDRFSINAVPTIIAFDKGDIISRRDAKMGAGLSKSDLDSLLKELEE